MIAKYSILTTGLLHFQNLLKMKCTILKDQAKITGFNVLQLCSFHLKNKTKLVNLMVKYMFLILLEIKELRQHLIVKNKPQHIPCHNIYIYIYKIISSSGSLRNKTPEEAHKYNPCQVTSWEIHLCINLFKYKM